MANTHMKRCSTLLINKENQMRYHLTLFRITIKKKIKNNKCSGNSAQCYVAAWMEGEIGGEQIHVYVWLSPAGHLKLSHY